VGLTLTLALRRRWTKALALTWPALVALSVIATGNHYVFDIAVGLAVTALGYAIGRIPNTAGRPLRVRSNLAVLPQASRPNRPRTRRRLGMFALLAAAHEVHSQAPRSVRSASAAAGSWRS
jgi:PAP2 superfamily